MACPAETIPQKYVLWPALLILPETAINCCRSLTSTHHPGFTNASTMFQVDQCSKVWCHTQPCRSWPTTERNTCSSVGMLRPYASTPRLDFAASIARKILAIDCAIQAHRQNLAPEGSTVCRNLRPLFRHTKVLQCVVRERTWPPAGTLNFTRPKWPLPSGCPPSSRVTKPASRTCTPSSSAACTSSR